VRELCGALTALQLFRRDALGFPISRLSLLLPAVLLHGLANFKGSLPLYKLGSHPWTELQLPPPSSLLPLGSGSPPAKLSALPRLLWYLVLARVAGYVCKNALLLGRLAKRRRESEGLFEARVRAGRVLKSER
jgi:hypothetical protein